MGAKKKATESSLSCRTRHSLTHLVIVGQSGAGKTTSMKHLCHLVLQDESFLTTINFPLVIRFREFNPHFAEFEAGNDKHILIVWIQKLLGVRIEYPEHQASDLQLADPLQQEARNRIIIECIDSLNILLIFDGSDEIVSVKVREYVLADVRQLAQHLDHSRIIMTSRTGEFNYHIDNTR